MFHLIHYNLGCGADCRYDKKHALIVLKKRMMNRVKHLMICMFLLISSMETVLAQEKLNEFVITRDENYPFTIRPGDGEYGFVVINTALSDLSFTIPSAPGRLKSSAFNNANQQWILKLDPNDHDYKIYRIKINSNGFKQGELKVSVKQKESICFDVNPLYEKRIIDYSAKITVFGIDGNPLEGARLTDRMTGRAELTNSDGQGTIKFENEGQTIDIVVTHPSYLDSRNIVVRIGDEKKLTLSTHRGSKWKSQKHTQEYAVVIGANNGGEIVYTSSFFLYGFGVNYMKPKDKITTVDLINSGYAGMFTKTTTTGLSGRRLNFFIDLGVYFNYISISCQTGFLFGAKVNKTEQYDGIGYGLVDGDINEYWGVYETRTFNNSNSTKGTYLTLTPQIKGYIPINKYIFKNVSVGVGYSFIPTLKYNTGLSYSIGFNF